MNIYCLGYMGAGKTTLGRKLAKALGYHFLDLDAYIEKTSGRKISYLFAEGMEDIFRKLERVALIYTTTAKQKLVISTGGGTPCFFDNMDIINRNGISIYFELDPQSLANRLMAAKEKRPLLKDKTEDELHAFITQHLKERDPFYRQAHLIESALNFDKARMDDLIARLQKNYFK
ncbi:MAG: shikimate kinase [Salibacteraceae bacterium]|mgnify:CR=1 FL=1